MARDVAAFAEHYRQKVSDWTARLEQMEQAGKKVVVWGAGSKGVMFMNTLNTQERISYVVDINPRKQGMHVAGSGQQIVSPAFLGDYQPDTIILMNPIYRDEVGRIAAEHGVAAELVSV
jgi:FlaA1/EpsC-like NDP-sugar epimerase